MKSISGIKKDGHTTVMPPHPAIHRPEQIKPTQPAKTAKSAPFRPIVEPDVKKPPQNP